MIIEFLIIGLDLTFATLITLAIPTGRYYHYWAPFLLLVAGYLLGVALMWGFLSLLSLPYKKDKTYEKPSRWAQFWLSSAITYINRHARAKINIINNCSLPKERFLIICNHRSKFDPVLMAELYGRKYDLAFISKPTNFKIPIGGRFMKATCYMPIDRYDKLKSLEVIKEATNYIATGACSVGVFPEGTRSENDTLNEFHEGVFSIALRAKCPLVITTIKNTEKIHKNFPFKRTKIDYEIVKILYPNEFEGMIAKELSDYARELMQNSLNA